VNALAVPPARPRRLAYLGTPEMAVPPLVALVEAGYEVTRVITRVDKRRGRGSELSPSPVKVAAERMGLPVGHRVDELLGLGVELGVVVAYGALVRPHVLAEVPMVNLHFSLLPRWRGAAPVERALLAGDDATGVCLMQLDEGLDTGGVYARTVVPIGSDDTGETLRERLVVAGTRLLLEGLAGGLGTPEPQHGDVSYAAKLDPAELELDWRRPAEELERVVRVGGAWTTFRGRRLKVHRALPESGSGGHPGELHRMVVTCGSGTGLRLVTVQPEGKGVQAATAWANGARPAAGERLGDGPAS
jgi:methionyl-tRNA formyltransferase